MSTTRKPPRLAKPTDPFFFGWRDTWRMDKIGRRRSVQVPLTEEDVLHPQEGDYIVHSNLHGEDRDYLRNVFRYVLADLPGALVFSNLGIFWDDPSLRHHAPDIAVIFRARTHHNWQRFDVAREGVRPRLIIEITSPSTRHADVVTKRDHYHRAGVEYYVIVDELPEENEDDDVRRLQLFGFRRNTQRYRRLALDEQGRL